MKVYIQISINQIIQSDSSFISSFALDYPSVHHPTIWHLLGNQSINQSINYSPTQSNQLFDLNKSINNSIFIIEKKGKKKSHEMKSHTKLREIETQDHQLIKSLHSPPLGQSPTQTIDHSTDKSNSQSLAKSINQSVDDSFKQSINQLVNPSINPSISQSVNQSINQSINQSLNHSLHQSLNLSIIRPVNHAVVMLPGK